MSRFARYRSKDSNLAVLVVAAVAVVSIVTGVTAMVTQPVVSGDGYVGTLQTATGYSAVIGGFLLLVAAWGMHRGLRIAYFLALSLIVLSAIQGVAQTRPLSVLLVVLSTGALVVLVRRRRDEFMRSVSLTETQVGVLIAIAGFVAYGTVGSYALRASIEGVDSLFDGFYFTIVTASTVGYGDMYATTEAGRLFAITLILLGPASIVTGAGTLAGPALEHHLARAGTRATRGSRAQQDDRVLLVGSDDLGREVVDSLATEASLTVLTPDEDWARDLEADDIDVQVGDPADEAVLERATGPAQSAIVVATDSATTPYAVVAARRVEPGVRVVAVTSGGREAELAEMGADVTIDPDGLLGRTTTTAALGRETGTSR